MTEQTQADNSETTLTRKMWVCIVCLLFAHALLLGYSAKVHSPTELEGPLLAAGVSHWELGRFDLYRVNPPLVRMVAAIPVIIAGCETDWSRFIDGPKTRPEYNIGKQFIEINGERSFWLMTLARWACIPFSLLGAVFCFLWSRELFNRTSAGLIAMMLWCFDPMVIGHGSLITNDVAAASLGLAAGYFFWRWLKSPTWTHAAIVGIFLALAILAKTTWLILFFLWPLIALVWFATTKEKCSKNLKYFGTRGTQLLTSVVIAVWLINLFYGFDESFLRYGEYEFISDSMRKIEEVVPFADSLPIPFPKQFTRGLDTQLSDLEEYHQPSYLRGQWRDEGWWYYYLYGLWVKTPHGTQLLLLVATLGPFFYPRTFCRRDLAVLLLPALAVLLIVSSKTALNHHFRYVLPCIGFAFVFLGSSALLMRSSKAMGVIVCSLLTLSIASTMWNYPHSLAYFNEIAGGSTNGHRHMLHSALDWGQDLIFLQDWLERHPDVHLDGLAYRGGFEPEDVGVEFPEPPESMNSVWTHRVNSDVGPLPGWFALSAMQIWEPQKRYDYFGQFFEPVAHCGYSIYVYHITLEEANRVRHGLGLPELPEDWKRE